MTTVIKHPAAERAKVFNLGDIAVEAKAIIARAQRQAEQIVAQGRVVAEQSAADVRQAAQQEGFAAGRQEGCEAARLQAARQFDGQIAGIGRTLADAIEQLAERRGQMLAEARQDLVGLALAIAEKVVRCRLSSDRQACQRTVEAAAELAGRASRLSVRVNPADLETIQAFAPHLASRLTGPAEVQVAADETVEPGGCRVVAWRDSGQCGEIDATMRTQLDRLGDELLGRDHRPDQPA